MNLPEISNYMDYKCDNYGDHSMRISMSTKKGAVTFWYSYRTIIGFSSPNHRAIFLKNYWGPTTGKHMGALCGRSNRMEQEEFDAIMEEQLKEIQFDQPFFIED